MNIKCKLFGHKWDMFAGYEQIRIHPNGICRNCGVKYNGII